MDAVLQAWFTIFVLIVCTIVFYLCASAYGNLLKLIFYPKKNKYRFIALLYLIISIGPVTYWGLSTEITGEAPSFLIRCLCFLVWLFSTPVGMCLPGPEEQERRRERGPHLGFSKREIESMDKVGSLNSFITFLLALFLTFFVIWALIVRHLF